MDFPTDHGLETINRNAIMANGITAKRNYCYINGQAESHLSRTVMISFR